MLGIIIFTIVVIVGGTFILLSNSPTQVTTEERSEVLELNDDDHIYSETDSEVVLIEYLDFECEACAAYYPVVKQIKEEYKDDISFIVRYFPLPGHVNSRFAAQAAEAASRQGLFWEMHDKLFENQLEWTGRDNYLELFTQYAEEIGLDMDKFETDYNDPTLVERINRDFNEGESVGVNSTPTFFLQEEKLVGVNTLDQFKSELDIEIAK